MSKTVWITGASSGIGREFARRYARLGFRLILTARRTDRLEALAAELTVKYNTFCRILPADLEQESECARLCEALADERLDIFINNAGFGVCGSFLETSGEKELSMAKVNVLAMHQLFKFAVKKMEAQGFGTVLNVASSAGLLPGGPYMAGYYATKAYVVSLTRGVAEELREQHSPVYVCALCPGPVDTEFNDRADVVFALQGIRPEFCVEEAMRGCSATGPSSCPRPSCRLRQRPSGSCRCPFSCPSSPVSRRKNWAEGPLCATSSNLSLCSPPFYDDFTKTQQNA